MRPIAKASTRLDTLSTSHYKSGAYSRPYPQSRSSLMQNVLILNEGDILHVFLAYLKVR